VPDQISIILNAHGGRLTGKKKVALIKQGMRATGLNYSLEQTEHPDHAIELAQHAALDGVSIVVAAGGDGTINEVVNGLLQASNENQPSTLGIIPFGSANDLADTLELPQNVTAACQRLAEKNTRLLDVGIVNGHYFVNNSAIGLESAVTMEQDQMRRVQGTLRYVLAAIKTIAKAQAWQARITWDNGIFEGPIVLISVGNSNRTGGAFYMTPYAKPDDGLLDFIYAMDMSRRQMFKLLPQTFSGKHVQHPMIGYLKTKTLSIKIDPATAIQADGEIINEAATKIEYQILPKKLRVIV
jgi:diacylglycerol kinase (ATP)